MDNHDWAGVTLIYLPWFSVILLYIISKFLKNWKFVADPDGVCITNLPLISPGLIHVQYKFVTGLRWAYKRRGLYPEGLKSGIKKIV